MPELVYRRHQLFHWLGGSKPKDTWLVWAQRHITSIPYFHHHQQYTERIQSLIKLLQNRNNIEPCLIRSINFWNAFFLICAKRYNGSLCILTVFRGTELRKLWYSCELAIVDSVILNFGWDKFSSTYFSWNVTIHHVIHMFASWQYI